MTNEEAKPLARTADLVTKEVADEVLVYDLRNHKAHCLNRTAATVWKYCDGQTTVIELAVRLKNDLNLALDHATIWQALDRLNKADLLEESVTSLAGSTRLGRRDAVRKLGLGSAIAIPIVMSIVAPPAQAACTLTSSNDPGSSCTGTPGSGSSGDVNCTVCATLCCAAPGPNPGPSTGTCVTKGGTATWPGTGSSNAYRCTRDCQCVSNKCNDPGPGNYRCIA